MSMIRTMMMMMMMMDTTAGPPVGHESTVWDASFDQSGTYLATCSDDKTVKIWHCKISPGLFVLMI